MKNYKNSYKKRSYKKKSYKKSYRKKSFNKKSYKTIKKIAKNATKTMTEKKYFTDLDSI